MDINKKVCPLCGYPIQLKYKNSYGLRLYICTNEPEVCGFMTNNYSAGKMSIQKCDKCRDGYVIVKKGRTSGFFLGCTNYKSNGTGCNNTISKINFYNKMGYNMEEGEIPQEKELVYNKCTVTPKTDTPLHEKKMVISNTQKDDYINIVRANIKPVLYGKHDLNDIIFTVVKALQNVSMVRFYGVTMITDVLKGSNTKRTIDNKLDKIVEFGALKDMPYETIKAVIEWMISEHLILKTKGKYPVLHSTYEGLHYSEFITEGKLKKLKKYLEEDGIIYRN